MNDPPGSQVVAEWHSKLGLEELSVFISKPIKQFFAIGRVYGSPTTDGE